MARSRRAHRRAATIQSALAFRFSIETWVNNADRYTRKDLGTLKSGLEQVLLWLFIFPK
jgi:hypothetical protein